MQGTLPHHCTISLVPILVFYMADMGYISGTPYGPLSPLEVKSLKYFLSTFVVGKRQSKNYVCPSNTIPGHLEKDMNSSVIHSSLKFNLPRSLFTDDWVKKCLTQTQWYTTLLQYLKMKVGGGKWLQ